MGTHGPVPKYQLSAEQYNKAAQDMMPEDEWQRFVEEALRHYGWTILLRFKDAAMYALWKLADESKPLQQILQQLDGWPDLLVSHPDWGPIWIECKTNKGVVRPNQREKIAQIRNGGGTVLVLRPKHRDEIDRLFRGKQR